MSAAPKKTLRTVSPALGKASERRRPGFSASKGEKEEKLEVKLLNLGLLVTAKVAVAEGSGVLSVPYFEVSTKDGLAFYVALSSPYLVPRADAASFGTAAFDLAAGGEVVSSGEVEEVLVALDALCGAAFVGGRGHCFLALGDSGEAEQTTILAASSPAGGGASSSAFPLVGQRELLSDPEGVLDNIREAWRRLYELSAERSSLAIRRLSEGVSSLADAQDSFAEDAETVSAALTDEIARLAPLQLQMQDQAKMGSSDTERSLAVEAALAESHAALRRLHAAVAEAEKAAPLLEEARQLLTLTKERLSRGEAPGRFVPEAQTSHRV